MMLLKEHTGKDIAILYLYALFNRDALREKSDTVQKLNHP
jgi:hypothetical protein